MVLKVDVHLVGIFAFLVLVSDVVSIEVLLEHLVGVLLGFLRNVWKVVRIVYARIAEVGFFAAGNDAASHFGRGVGDVRVIVV